MKLSPTSTVNLIELQYWCQNYHANNQHPMDFFVRFSVGFYQIYQGIDWSKKIDKYNKNESYAAAAVHFIMVCECLKLPIEVHIHPNLAALTGENAEHINWRDLLYYLSKAQQHLFYYYKTFHLNPNYHRKSRYNKATLTVCMANVIRILIGAIQPDLRDSAIEDATRIMTGAL